MKKKYEIELIGCDDTTEFIMSLSEDEFKTLKKISYRSHQVSTYECKPILNIELKKCGK